MKNSFENGTVIAQGKLYEKANYDVSNRTMSAAFDGSGGITYCQTVQSGLVKTPIKFISIAYNGKKQDVLPNKKVSMIGRKQSIAIDLQTAVLNIEQFVDETGSGIYVRYRLSSDKDSDVAEIGLIGGAFAKGACTGEQTFVGDKFAVCTDKPLVHCPQNLSLYFSLHANETYRLKLIFDEFAAESDAGTADWEEAYSRNEQLIQSVEIPENLSQEEKALYASAYWCSLENYKETENYAAFMAGCRYLNPMRSYYRDSYYTVLPMYKQQSEKVKNQILTLAKGIADNGECPSAVISDYTPWWSNHYDSPSFMIMMLYDYIHYTGDCSVADVMISEQTVFEKAVAALTKLSLNADETSLIYKDGKYNKRDWADEVNRYGYVTYDNALYARGLYCAAQIFRLKHNDAEYQRYMQRFETVKDAINRILWCDATDCYVNFKNQDYTEDNISIDTVFTVIFGIAEGDRAVRCLKTMEAVLETPNAASDVDFGCMCVYPFYQKMDAASNKSTQAFDYHNGANWPYLTAMYAYAKRSFHMEYKSVLLRTFRYALDQGMYTLPEYFSPYCENGSNLQAWSGAAAFVLDEEVSRNFFG